MRTVNLASGSKGNCTYIESNLAKILVDDGLSLTNLEARLKQINVNPDDITAILLTHEHSDHLHGIKFFLKKHRTVKVYIPAFVKNYGISAITELPMGQIEWYSTSDFFIKDVTVSAIVLPHDSKFCVGYSLHFGGRKISVCTDLGFMSKQTLAFLSGSDLIFLESNHDENLLKQNPRYPIRTKKRILGNMGHLSNTSCAAALVDLVKSGVRQVVLSHLSEENNTPELAYATVKNFLLERGIIEGKHVCVDVAFQHKIGTIFEL